MQESFLVKVICCLSRLKNFWSETLSNYFSFPQLCSIFLFFEVLRNFCRRHFFLRRVRKTLFQKNCLGLKIFGGKRGSKTKANLFAIIKEIWRESGKTSQRCVEQNTYHGRKQKIAHSCFPNMLWKAKNNITCPIIQWKCHLSSPSAETAQTESTPHITYTPIVEQTKQN